MYVPKIHIMLQLQTLQTKLLMIAIWQYIALIVPMVVGLKTESRLLELQSFQIVLLNLVIRRCLQLQHQRLTNMTQDMGMIPQMAPLIVYLVIISMKVQVQVLVCNVPLGIIVRVVLHNLMLLVVPRKHNVLLEHIIPV